MIADLMTTKDEALEIAFERAYGELSSRERDLFKLVNNHIRERYNGITCSVVVADFSMNECVKIGEMFEIFGKYRKVDVYPYLGDTRIEVW